MGDGRSASTVSRTEALLGGRRQRRGRGDDPADIRQLGPDNLRVALPYPQHDLLAGRGPLEAGILEQVEPAGAGRRSVDNDPLYLTGPVTEGVARRLSMTSTTRSLK